MTPSDILKKYWGYASFRPLQADIIDSVLKGTDTLGLMPTGGGKSITFQVPALMLPGLTLVVTPLISLMKDQVDALKEKGIKAAALYSGLTFRERNVTCDKARLGKIKLLYVSPERLKSEDFRAEIRTWRVNLIVVDEAHCISQWGYDFRPSYLQIATLRDIFPDVPVLALTASATPAVRTDIVTSLAFRKGFREFALSFHRHNLSYVVRYDHEKEGKLIAALSAVGGSAIVYVRSRIATARIAETLCAAGIPATFYHAGLDAKVKEERQQQWKENKTRVMVATNAFGMGIDKPDVRVVVHMDIPPSLEEYYQEAGRAGRDGKHAYALMIASPTDKATLTKRLNAAFPPREFILDVYEKACVFMDIPVGEGYNQVFEFDIVKFCKIFHFDQDKVNGALTILTNAGYFDYNEDPTAKARVLILIRKEEFYHIKLENNEQVVINTILRLYPGLFADYINIDEESVASVANLPARSIYEAFLSLSRKKIIHYIPKRLLPYIYLPTSREDQRYVAIPRAIYDDRRELMKKRIDAIRSFVFGAEECRDVVLLRYFGESSACSCGMCDICISRKKQAVQPGAAKSDTRDSLRREIMELVTAMPGIEMDAIMQRFPSFSKEIPALLRNLISEKLIERKGNRLFTAR